MKNRGPAAIIALTIVTIGIYGIYWMVSTKNEMNRLGAKIPTAWLIIIPFVNIWWLWKYSEGVEKVTNAKMSGVMAFVLLWLISIIGMVIVQLEFNKLGQGATASAGATDTPSPAPADNGPAPDNSFGGAPDSTSSTPSSTETASASPSDSSSDDSTTTPPATPVV